MTIHLRVRPEFSEDDYTDCYFLGDDEDAVANVVASRLRGAEWDVLFQDDGEEDDHES